MMIEINWNEVLLNLKEVGFKILNSLIVILIVFIISKIFLAIISKGTKKVIEKETKDNDSNSKQIITTMTVTRSVIRYVVYAIALFIILDFFGLGNSVNNILVTAGIGGLIISLGAQSFVKDMISGFFILFERQFSVGDYVEVAGKEGKVTAISIRATYLDYRGQKVVVPNGQITNVVNYNNEYNIFRIVVPTSYEANTKEIVRKLKKILNDFYKKNQDLFVSEPEVLGVTNFNSSSIDLTIQGKCKSMKHFEAERELRLYIKEEFDKLGIEIPYQKIEITKNK